MAEVQVQIGQWSDRYAFFPMDVGGRDLWRKNLFWAIARTTFCDLVYRRGQSVVGLIGEKEDVEGVQAMYMYVVDQLERMAVRDLHAYPNGWRNGSYTLLERWSIHMYLSWCCQFNFLGCARPTMQLNRQDKRSVHFFRWLRW